MNKAIVFIDGQNLYRSAKDAFGMGIPYPNYCLHRLPKAVCSAFDLTVQETRFYTGIPDKEKDGHWHRFWQDRKLQAKRQGVVFFDRRLQYLRREFHLDNGGSFERDVVNEKGIDVRIAIDLVMAAVENRTNNIVLFSQDQDLSEATSEAKKIAAQKGNDLKIICAFPESPTSRNPNGVYHTDWYRFNWDFYQKCIDPLQYRR